MNTPVRRFNILMHVNLLYLLFVISNNIIGHMVYNFSILYYYGWRVRMVFDNFEWWNFASACKCVLNCSIFLKITLLRRWHNQQTLIFVSLLFLYLFFTITCTSNLVQLLHSWAVWDLQLDSYLMQLQLLNFDCIYLYSSTLSILVVFSWIPNFSTPAHSSYTIHPKWWYVFSSTIHWTPQNSPSGQDFRKPFGFRGIWLEFV